LESQVKDSRPSEDGGAIRRRRFCSDCGGRFTTFERVQLRELTIVKRSGRRTPFEREKLVRSVSLAMRKRPIDPERVERMVSAIVRQLESRGETELPSTVVGELVMKSLKALDEVAYVRYASVYRDFRETEDFARFLGDEGLNDETALDEGLGPQVLLDGHDAKLNEVGSGSSSLDERIKI
jgi:transcriptional repressor NrdR